MWWLIAPCFYCPFRDDDHRKDAKEKAELRKDRDYWKNLAIENGLETGGSIYVQGQKNE